MYKNKFVSKRDSDIKALTGVILAFLLIAFLVSPPWNKFAQACLFTNNTKLFFAKIFDSRRTTEWIYHRNNAVYLMDMGKKSDAIKELNEALNIIPRYETDEHYNELLHNRALVRLAIEDYSGALGDFLRVDEQEYDVVDNLRIAMLFKSIGNWKQAMSYCNEILTNDSKAYAGYACTAEVYSFANRNDLSVKVYDMLIAEHPNKAIFYSDRAIYKQRAGIAQGIAEDRNKAKELNPKIDLEYLLVDYIMSPKSVKLETIPIKA